MFFPVLLQELIFLGEKIFYKRRADQNIAEINALIDFLVDFSNREKGQEYKESFEGAYCRCGIVIIAKYFKVHLGNLDPYIYYIVKLLDKKLETIYLVGPDRNENSEFMQKIGSEICKRFNLHLSLLCENNIVIDGTQNW